jgi:hypothetical protein
MPLEAPTNPLRALAWPRPKGLNLVRPLEVALKRLGEAWAGRRGELYKRLCDDSPLFREEGATAARSRRMRSDGASNLIALLQALLASCELASGFIGRPAAGGWDRFAWAVLDVRAYGAVIPGGRSFRRTQRWVRTLKGAGLLTISEIKVPQADGSIKSVVAIKSLTTALFKLLNLTQAVAQARRLRDRRRGEEARQQIEETIRGKARQTVQAPTIKVPAVTTTPAQRGGAPPPAPREQDPKKVADEIAKIKAKLGLKD